jgi:hypothetical protein
MGIIEFILLLMFLALIVLIIYREYQLKTL